MSSDPTAEHPDAEQTGTEPARAQSADVDQPDAGSTDTPRPEQPAEGQSAASEPAASQPTVARSAEPRSEPRQVPDAEELARVAEPATVRRAPRYRAFVLSGVVVGVLVAFVLVLTLGGGRDDAPDSGLPDLGTAPVLIFTALTFAVVGALLGGLIALLLDRRSRR